MEGIIQTQSQLTLWDRFAESFDLFIFILSYAPYWAPPVLLVVFMTLLFRYNRAEWIAKQKYVVLEIRLPQDTMKSPLAMQMVFDAINVKSGEGTILDRLWTGKVRAWYSFEMASFEGQVHFYVWTRDNMRRIVERAFYANYPDCEVLEVEDYATKFPFSLETHSLDGTDYKLDGPIGVPIKTYTDFKLDQASLKEDQKSDPLAHVLELLGSMGKGEYFWLQIICRANKAENITFGLHHNEKGYADLAKEEITKIRNSPEETIKFANGTEGKVLSDAQLNRIKAINHALLASSHWDVGIRSMYIGEKEYYDGTNSSALRMLWQPFNSPLNNSITIDPTRWFNTFDYPWQDYKDMTKNKLCVRFFDAYRRRSWFHLPYRFDHFMMTSEELATIFHIPGSVARTPTLTRIQSTRGQAPANIPL